MELVKYSDSEDESGKGGASPAVKVTEPRKRKREDNEERPKASKLPPLPQNFHSLYATAARTHPSDDPALHGGRTRQVPHVEGNWPTHVYLECRSSSVSPTRV